MGTSLFGVIEDVTFVLENSGYGLSRFGCVEVSPIGADGMINR